MARIKVTGVYKIESLTSGKVYIGSSVCVNSRLYVHRRRLNNGNHHSIKLQRAWVKYGEKDFIFDLIEAVASEDQLIEREQHWIEHYQSYTGGYNSCAIAGRTTGYRASEESCKRRSESKKGFVFTDDHRANISKAMIGHRHSDETKARISAANRAAYSDASTRERVAAAKRGKKASAEARERMSASHKARYTQEERDKCADRARGRKHSEETKAKIAASNGRRVVSDETRQKMSIALKEYNAKKRASEVVV